jgi:hypothetical protein
MKPTTNTTIHHTVSFDSQAEVENFIREKVLEDIMKFDQNDTTILTIKVNFPIPEFSEIERRMIRTIRKSVSGVFNSPETSENDEIKYQLRGQLNLYEGELENYANSLKTL